jgi:hypothetical protein
LQYLGNYRSVKNLKANLVIPTGAKRQFANVHAEAGALTGFVLRELDCAASQKHGGASPV